MLLSHIKSQRSQSTFMVVISAYLRILEVTSGWSLLHSRKKTGTRLQSSGIRGNFWIEFSFIAKKPFFQGKEKINDWRECLRPRQKTPRDLKFVKTRAWQTLSNAYVAIALAGLAPDTLETSKISKASTSPGIMLKIKQEISFLKLLNKPIIRKFLKDLTTNWNTISRRLVERTDLSPVFLKITVMRSNNLVNNIPLNIYLKDQPRFMKVLAESSFEPPLEWNQKICSRFRTRISRRVMTLGIWIISKMFLWTSMQWVFLKDFSW